jgi:hypothetical protein
LNPRYQTSHGESHISKCQSLLNHKEEVIWIRSEVLIIYCEDPLLRAQVKIMLISSSLDKDENGTKKNQVDKLKFILICFISLLSIGRRTIKRDAAW